MAVTNYRGHQLEIDESTSPNLVHINGKPCKYQSTAAGFCVGYHPPQPTLRGALELFLDTQPTTLPYRESFTDLSPDKQTRLADALNQIYNNGAAGNLIDANADLHDDNFYNGIHWGPAFLPWHRDFLRKLEIAIQRIHRDLTLPYWDWTRSDSRDLNSGPWKTIFGGRSNTGGKFASWSYFRNSSPGDSVLPVLSTGTPNAVSVVEELTATTFQSFRRLETGSHFPGHTWTGGTMASRESPRDPLFYLHHCNLDRLWSIWQLNNSSADQYTLDPNPGGLSVPQAAVPLNDPMIGGATPASMLNHESLGYRYPQDLALEQARADAGHGTLITGT